MMMATANDYANWLRANENKRGTPDYQTVLRAFQEATIEESRAVQAPPPAAPKESTIFGELARGTKQLVSTSRTGIGALTAPEEAARAGVERGQQIAAEAGEGPSFAALRKVYEERGLLPAAGELVSQIPRAVAGQLPQLAALAGGAKLGAMAGTAVLPGAGTIAGGVLGAGATLLPQFFGANIERQAAEQMERGEPVQIDRGAAAAAAAGQAAIESAGTAFVLGKRVVKGVLGIADDAGLATAKARADLVKAAERSRLGAAGRGAAVGLAEIPVEVAQAVIERAQAGLDVLSPEAISEYGENAYLAGLVGPTIGAATRVTEPGAARQKLAAEEQTKVAAERKAAREAEEAKKKDPAYALKLDADYQAAVARMKELQAAVPKRPAKDALPEEQMAYKEAVEARNTHLKEVLQPLAAEYVPRKAEIAQLKERQRVEGMSPLDYMLEQTETAPIRGVAPGAPAPTTVEDTEIFPTIRPTAPALAYAQQRIQLANEQAFADSAALKEQADIYAQYLLQNPTIARQLLATKPNIPDLTAKQNTAVYKKLEDLLKQQVQQQTAEIEAEGLKAREFTYEEQALEDARRLREEEAFADEERMREEEAMAVEPFRKEEAVISPEREEQIKALDTARKRYLAAADTYQKARGTPDGARALQQLLAARKEYDSFSTTPLGGQAPRPVLSPETEAQLDQALRATVGEAPATEQELEARIQRMADTRKTAIAKVSENASELAQYERLTQYMGTPQGLSEVARTPEMAEAAKRRMTPMLEQAQASRNEAIAAAIQEIRLQRDLSGLAPLDKSDADLQSEFREKLNKDLQQAKGKAKVDDKKRQEAIAQQIQRINARIQQLESGDRGGRLLGYASAFRTQPERVGELNNLYKAYRNLSMQQGLTPQAAQLNRTLQNIVDFYTVGGGAAKQRVVAKGPREAQRELVLGERAFTGYEPTVEGTEVRYQKPRKMAEYAATPEEQALVEDMRGRELAELNEAADRQYTPETSDRVKKQIFDALRSRIDNFNAPATQEEVEAARAQAAPRDEATGDLFAAATERAQAELQAAGERRTAARSELGRAMAGMRGKSAIMDQAQRLAEKFGKDLGLEGTFAAAKQRLTQAQAAKRAAETEFTEKEQEALRAAADDALIAQRDAEAADRAANNTVDAIKARLEAEKETPTVEVRTPPRAVVLLRKIVALQSLIGEQRTSVVSGDKVGATFAPVTDVGGVKSALDQALRAAKEGEAWASDIEQVQAHMAAIKAQLQRGFLAGKLQELQAQYSKLAAHETALRRPMYGAGQLTPAEIRDYTQRRLEMAQAEYDRIKLQIDGLHRQLLDTEVAVAKREVGRITGEINALVSRMERREGADLANQELKALTEQHKDAVANLEAAQKTFDERKKAESVPFTRKSPASALEQWMKGAQDRFEQSVQRFKAKQTALERQATAPAATPATTAAERRAEVARERGAPALPELQYQLEGALKAQAKVKKRGSKKQREAIAEKIADLKAQIARLTGESTFGKEYYESAAQEQAAEEARAEAEAREAGKEETTRAGRRKAAKEIFGVQRTIAETGEVPQATKDGNKLDSIIKSNRQAFEMAVEQGFKSTAIRPQKRGKSATPERLMRTPLEGIAYRLRQEIVEKLEAPQTKKQKQELTKLREHLYGLEEAINTAPVTVEERRRTARAIWAKLPKDMRNSLVDTFKGRTESGGVSTSFFDRFADALETTVIRQRLGQPLSQAPVTTMTKAELAPIQAETEKRVAATMKATEELRQKYYEQKEKELTEQARLKGEVSAIEQQRIEKEANAFADRVMQRFEEEKAREATRRMTEPMRGKAAEDTDEFLPTPKRPAGLVEKAPPPPAPVKKLPPMTAEQMQAARAARAATELPRIDSGAPDSAFYKATGFQPEASAPFHKMTLAEAARFGASKARGQRKELFTQLADLFDEATTPEKQGLVLATNGKTNKENAYGAFYRKSNVVFSPGTTHTNYLETLLHELTHAASWYALSVDKRLAGRVESLRRKAVAWAETREGKAYIRKHAMFLVSKDQQGNRGIYGLKNIDEFLSELYADREFQKFLTQIPSDAPKKNLLTRFVEFMSSFFSAPAQAQQSLFAEAVALSEEVLETTRREIYGTDIDLREVRRGMFPFGKEGPPDVAFSTKLPTAARVAEQIVGQQKGWLQKLRENFLGIGGRAQFVDMRFPLEEAFKRGGVEDLDAMQAMYYVRMYDQKMHFTSEAITEGVPEVVEKTRKDGRTERIIEAKAGANLTQAYKILTSKEVIKEAGSADAANKLVTLYMASIRGANKGYDKLNFGRAWATQEIQRLDGELKRRGLEPAERANLQKRRESLVERLDTLPTVEDIKASRAEIEANPVLREAFDKVREVYNEYNRNLLQLAVQTGAISKDHARTLLAQNDYIPYYRMRGGVAEMVIGDETPIRIGNIKDNQELQELVGGDEPILDFITSSMQNTSMLVDMSLRNIAMKNAMFELRDVGLATVAKEPKGGAPKGSVTFKKDGEDYYAMVNTEALGISSDLLVKGLAGIPTMFPMWVRAMGVPARILRRAIVAAPPYWAKQVFRDSLGAAMSSGADIVPVLGALRQIGKENVLERRGITGGQVFTGLPEDKKRMLDAMQSGKVSLTRGMAWLEATSAKADALTRKNQYENYLAQGLSEMEATYMALESMNFSKRGLSPSVHYANILIPFFNSQIQGLDALYKAFTGKMPMNERLEIRQKLWTRGMLMFAMSMAYAAMMQDDEAYKNAKPDEKYGNWFVPLKNFGIDETLRLPIPFELGYIFKALPEAIVNSMLREEGAKEARDAFLHIAQQTIPGGSSLGIPAAVKPALETVLGVSSYTGRPIESAQEQEPEPGYRTRENTTELARQIGEMTNFSPVKLEFLVRGYTGSMGMAALAALSAPFGSSGPEPATKRLTDLPVFGTMFQPKDASGIIDATYERLNKVNQLVKTHEKLLQEGRVADAEKYFAEHQDDMALGSLAGSFKQFMGEVTQVERAVRSSPTMTPEKKREYLDYLRQVKIRTAESVRDSVRAASGRKTPQAVPA